MDADVRADPKDPQPSGYLLSINTSNGDSVLVGPYRSRERCESDRWRIDQDIRALGADDVRFTTIEPLFPGHEFSYVREQMLASLRGSGYTLTENSDAR